MSDIGRLYRRSALQGQDPKENFTTEALAVAINRDNAPFLLALGRAEWPAGVSPIDLTGLASVRASTQEYLARRAATVDADALRDGYLDLVLTFARSDQAPIVVWIEVKIDADESGDQLDVYAEHARLDSIPPVILALSRKRLRDLTRNGTPVGWLPWTAIAAAIDGRQHDPWWDDLLAFLREEFVVRPAMPSNKVDPEAVIGVLKEVNELLRRRWPGQPLTWAQPGRQASWARTTYEAEGRIYSTGGPLTYGLVPIGGEWFWSISMGSHNYQRVRLDVVGILQRADRSGALSAWSRQTSPDAALEKRIGLSEMPVLDDAVDWFARSIDELHEADMLRDFFDGFAAKQSPKLQTVLDRG